VNTSYSCKKNYAVVSPASIVGQWTWIKTYPPGNPASYPHYPITPQNSGSAEKLIFNANQQFSQTVNDSLIQSGTYTTGHGSYLPYPGRHLYTFDSVCCFVQGLKKTVNYYSVLNSDTLVFSSSYAGVIGGGSKYYAK
jgi:hypothetical protein